MAENNRPIDHQIPCSGYLELVPDNDFAILHVVEYDVSKESVAT